MALPLIIHQSDIGSFNYCPARFKYESDAVVEHTNSRLAYGTVMHHAMHVLELTRDLEKAEATFRHYWHPLNIDELTPPVPRDGWLGWDSYGEMLKRGVWTLRRMAELREYDRDELLGLEYEFCVPLHMEVEFLGAVRPVWMAGTIDRLAVRWYRQNTVLCVDDNKTGKQKWNLRDNLQGTAYAYATLQPEFWVGGDIKGVRLGSAHGKAIGETRSYSAEGFAHQRPLDESFEDRAHELIARFEGLPRRFTWVDLKNLKIIDGGYRGPKDYARMKLGIEQVIQSVSAGIFPLRIDGEVCTFCPFRRTCGGAGVPDPEHGDPAFHYALPTT